MSALSSFTRKTIVLGLVVAGLAASLAPAEARWRRGPRGGVVAAAAIGGLAAGALIAGAASRRAYAAPGYGYYSAPVYAAPVYSAPVYSAPAVHYYGHPAYHAQPAYYTPAYRPYRPRPVYRHYASHEPICTIRRKRVWLGPNTYTFRRVTVCR